MLRVVIPPSTPPRKKAYARPHLIVLINGLESENKMFHVIAHEAAHLWWNNAVDPKSRHNFLNESFAEYTSFMAIREVYGIDNFQKWIKKSRKEAKNLPSISEWTPQLNGPLMYSKGPYLLYQLEKRIGQKKFAKYLQTLLDREIGTIEGMIHVLEDVTNEETATWFKKKL